MEVSNYKVDKDLANKGIKVFPFDEKCWFLMRYGNCDLAEATRMDLTKKFRMALSAGGQMAADAMREINCRLLVDVYILGWNEDALSLDGELLKYSKENAYRLVRASDLVRDRLLEECSNASLYKPVASDEDAQGN